MASKHRDIGLKFRYRSTPNTRRVTKNVGCFFGEGEGGGYHIYIYICIAATGLVYCTENVQNGFLQPDFSNFPEVRKPGFGSWVDFWGWYTARTTGMIRKLGSRVGLLNAMPSPSVSKNHTELEEDS